MPMIKCTDEQAYLIELCLETMCRATLGQLTHFVESIEKIRGKLFKENKDLISGKNSAEALLKKIKAEKEALQGKSKGKTNHD